MDGALLPEEEARTVWTQFSQHMDANEGDLAGFAKGRGWISVSPEYRKGQAVLVVKTTASAPAAPAKSAPAVPSSGSVGAPRKRRRRR
jgi:hypothetical protein